MQNLSIFLRVVFRRFVADSCPRTAASLSYTTILSLAPLLVIAFALIGAFPAFSGMEEQLRNLIFDTFVPTAGSAIDQYFTGFAKNAGKLTTIGIVALVLTVILLLLNIQDAFDSIWKSAQKNSMLFNMLKYWAFVTLGPLLMGTSLSISSIIYAQAITLNLPGFEFIQKLYSVGLNGLIETVAFFLLYAFMPNTTVLWRHAMLGAIVTSVLFKLLKASFVLYITRFPTYEAIYGTLATVPIFLFWVYLCWMAALLGAEIVAAMPEYRRLGSVVDGKGVERRLRPAELIQLALGILRTIATNASQKRTTRMQDLLNEFSVSSAQLHRLMKMLTHKGYILSISSSRYSPLADLEERNLYELAHDLNLTLETQFCDMESGFSHLKSILSQAESGFDDLKQHSLKKMLIQNSTEIS